MENRRNLVVAVCSLGAALAVCAFATRAPGDTLNALLTNDRGLGAYGLAPCTSGGFISANARGFSSIGVLNCSTSAFNGTTVHVPCRASARTVVDLRADGGPQLCTSSAAWGALAQCTTKVDVLSFPINLSGPPQTCQKGTTLYASGWGSNP